MVAANSSKKLSEEAVQKLDEEASKNWDKFYGIHQVIREMTMWRSSRAGPESRNISAEIIF